MFPLPGIPLFRLLWLLLALALPTAFWPGLLPYWRGLAGFGGVVALLDLLRLCFVPVPTAQRRVPGHLSAGRWQKVRLRLHNPGRRSMRLEVFDHYPAGAGLEGLPHSISLPAGGWGGFHYRIRPTERGEWRFPRIQYRLHSPWGLWKRNHEAGLEHVVRVYPDFAAVAKYMLLAGDNRVGQMGVRKRRRRGEGLDFHQLRKFREGDSLRQIDWKTTSRLRQPIAREYQDERDQEIVFLLDCGQRMLAKDSELSHFDHSLNAMLLLAYVALRQGDAVGLITFGGPRRWLKPAKGRNNVNRLLNALYDLQPTHQVADYLEAAKGLMARQKKRALVILVTNLRDQDNEDLVPAVRALRRRHLVLLASLQERAILDMLEKPVRQFEDAVRIAAAHHYQADRRRAIERLHAQGIDSLDVTPESLSVELVNRYLDIKAGGRL